MLVHTHYDRPMKNKDADKIYSNIVMYTCARPPTSHMTTTWYTHCATPLIY